MIAEIGLNQEEGTESRVAVASLVAAWESSRLQASTEEKLRVESRLGLWCSFSEMAAMTKAVEAECEVPAKSLVAAKLEQLEQGALQAEDLMGGSLSGGQRH